jgi:hypothetical protein
MGDEEAKTKELIDGPSDEPVAFERVKIKCEWGSKMCHVYHYHVVELR